MLSDEAAALDYRSLWMIVIQMGNFQLHTNQKHKEQKLWVTWEYYAADASPAESVPPTACL